RYSVAISSRRTAEIQLNGILNDPENFHRRHSTIPTVEYTIKRVAELLNTCPFIVERLLFAMKYRAVTTLSIDDLQKITRVLNSTFDTRTLVFFIMLDSNDDKFISGRELQKFYEQYLSEIKSLSVEKRDEVIKTLQRKLGISKPNAKINFEEFHTIISEDPNLVESLSKFTVQPLWYLSTNTDGQPKKANEFLRKLIPVDDHIDYHQTVGRIIGVLSIVHTIAHFINFGVEGKMSWPKYIFTLAAKSGWVHGFAPLSGVLLCVILAVIVICSMSYVRRGGHFQVFYWTHLLYAPFFILLILHAENFWKWIIAPLTVFLFEKVYSLIARFSAARGRTSLKSVTIEHSNVVSLNIHRPKSFDFRPGDYVLINIPKVAYYEWHPFTISSAPEEGNIIQVHISAVGNWTKQVYNRYKEMSQTDHDVHVPVHRADVQPVPFGLTIQEEDPLNDTTVDSVSIQLDSPQLTTEKRQSVDSEKTTETEATEESQATSRQELIFINGPYSSCARYIFDCKHVVLIGAGIGITPYASILSSLMAQFRASRFECKKCSHINYNMDRIQAHRLKKVDFIWVNRDIKNFEWFLSLLRSFELEQESYLVHNPDEPAPNRFLDMHLYFTALRNEGNIGSAPFDLVTRVYQDMCDQDIFTNLKVQTYTGRPKWDDIFKKLKRQSSNKNDVNVFFCGPATMAAGIKQYCQQYKFRFYEEKF
ncbi:unnamed protein product, partial [Didymodactylos carnosus]